MAEIALWLVLLTVLVASNVAALRYFATSFGVQPALGFTWRNVVNVGLLLSLASGAVLIVAYVPLKLCYPTYVISSNAMAPTLSGRHFSGTCPHCGGRTVVGFVEDRGFDGLQRRVNPEGICTACQQVGPAQSVVERVQVADRILTRALATPRRWDLVVFRYPGDRQSIYIMRLVGLPGESVEVKEGKVWINGVRQDPPLEIADLRWFLPEDFFPPEFAAPGNPITLADGECFVLGDYSTVSSDSRFWGPVPTEDILGVASAVYFPSRSARWLLQH